MTITAFAPLAASAIVVAKASLLIAFGWCVTRLLRRAQAVARHLVWLTVIVGALLTPVVGRLVSVPVPVLPRVVSTPVAPPTMSPSPISPLRRAPSASTPTIDSRAAGGADYNAPTRSMSIAKMLIVAWVIGAVIMLVRLFVGIVVVERLIRSGRSLHSPEWAALLADGVERLGVTAVPRLVMSDQVEMAFAFDVLSPAIILPMSAREWSADRRRTVLLHELAHIRRRDLIGHSVAGVACAVYWFNPFMWSAARQLRVESELASDEIVLAAGVRPSEYAQHLLDMVTSVGRSAPTVALAMARPKEFEGRLVAILDPLRRRSAYARSHSAAVVALLALVVVSIGAAVPVPMPVSRARAAASASGVAASALQLPAVRAVAKTAQPVAQMKFDRPPVTTRAESNLSPASIASLLRYGTGGIINPMIMLLRESDSLQLTGAQADSIATLNRRYMVRLSAIWSPVSAYYLARATGVESPLPSHEISAAPRATIDALLELVPHAESVLTPRQRERLSPLTASYLDEVNLRAIRDDARSVPDGVFLPANQLFQQRGRGRSGGGG